MADVIAKLRSAGNDRRSTIAIQGAIVLDVQVQ